MSIVHEDMELEGEYWRPSWAVTLAQRIGVAPAEPSDPGVGEVLAILGDGEAHTISTIDGYLKLLAIEMSGCEIASCLARLSEDGHQIEMMGPYDTFGSPERFKLLAGEAA